MKIGQPKQGAGQKGDYMRKTVIYCDRCGTEIKGRPIQVIPEYSDMDGNSGEPYLKSEEEQELPQWIEKMLDKEFCEDCAKRIFDFALNTTTVKINENGSDQKVIKSDPTEVNWDVAVKRIKTINHPDGTQCQGAVLCQG